MSQTQTETGVSTLELQKTDGAHTGLISIGPELMQIPTSLPCWQESNQPYINADYGYGQSCSSSH